MGRWVAVALVILTLAALFYVLFPGVVYALSMRAERTLAGLSTEQLTLDGGVRVVYTDGGEGEPLVLLHGFTADKDNWTRLARYLTPHMRVVAPDLPGFGASTRDPALDYSIEAQLERLEAFVDKLGIGRFHIGGSSMGGNLAGHFAARHPQRILSLWLLAPAGVAGSEPSEMSQTLTAGGRHPLIPATRAEFEATLEFVFVQRPFIPGAVRRHLASVAIERQSLRRRIFDDLLDESRTDISPPLTPALSDLPVPALIVWGRQDRVLHPSGAEVLGQVMSRAEVQLLEGAGHLPMLEAPEATARRYLRFRHIDE